MASQNELMMSNEDGHFSDYEIQKQQSSSYRANSTSQQRSFLPNKEFGDITDKINKQEISTQQISQRIDIFEEEIIKRVREIQKYSKGLNQQITKKIGPEVDKNKESLKGVLEKMEQQTDIFMQSLEEHQTMMSKLEGQINENHMDINEKLKQQTQLISLLDDQITN